PRTSPAPTTILFGEHSVVYNKLAVATAVNLRSYAVDLAIPLSDLEPLRSAGSLHDPQTLTPEARTRLVGLVEACWHLGHVGRESGGSRLGALHLIDGLCPGPLPSLSLTLRSEIPIGSGLGSSASLSVAVVAAIMDLGGMRQRGQSGRERITSKTVAPPADTETEEVPDKNVRELINAWALIAEKVIHGNPSGVDNTVVTYGGALAYTKTEGMQTLTDLPSLEFLLIDSKVTKNTMIQVNKVRARRDLLPLGHPTLDAIVAMAERHGFAGKLTALGWRVFRTRVGGVGVRVHGPIGLTWDAIENGSASPKKKGKKRAHVEAPAASVGMDQWRQLEGWMREASVDKIVSVFGQGEEPEVAAL
ncbi:ribosomal protein S5 domain 2-type protein, partial [Catenaria anguillulae PL171]